MRYLLLSVVASLALAGCGSPSTLSEDDQAFCSEQEDELGAAREAADEIVNGDRHWSSDGEAFALNDLAVTPASDWLTSYDAQDSELDELVHKAGEGLFGLRIALPDNAFEDDAQAARDVSHRLDQLQAFCDENA